MTFKNGITTKVEYKKTRILTLSMTANQIVETSSKDFVVGMGYKVVDLKLFGAGKSKNKVSNDLNIQADFSIRNQSALSRDIQEALAQPTSGNKATKFSLSADYTFSKLLTIRMYYDRQKNTPPGIFRFLSGNQFRFWIYAEVLVDKVRTIDRIFHKQS